MYNLENAVMTEQGNKIADIISDTFFISVTCFFLDKLIKFNQAMMELLQFLDILMSYLRMVLKLTVKRFMHTAIVTTLI